MLVNTLNYILIKCQLIRVTIVFFSELRLSLFSMFATLFFPLSVVIEKQHFAQKFLNIDGVGKSI